MSRNRKIVPYKTTKKLIVLLVFAMCDDIQNIELVDALRSLMTICVELANGFAVENTETIKVN